MLGRTRGALLAAAAIALAPACGGEPRSASEPPSKEERKPSLSSFLEASAILPPAPFAIAWADVDAFRSGSVSSLLGRLDGGIPVPAGADVSFFKDNLDSIHRIAGGIWVTMAGPSLFVALEGDLPTEELFTMAREWASSRNATVTACKVRERPGLRIGNTVLVDTGESIFLNGPESLASRTLDLMSGKATGNALDQQVVYLATNTIHDEPTIVIAGVSPPSSTEWLQKKNLPSVVGSRFLLSVRTQDAIDMRLGLLPGRPIKPIWFAQEVNTFLVRAAKDPGVEKLELGDWVEGLDVELLSKGIVVRGSIGQDKLLEVIGVPGGGS